MRVLLFTGKGGVGKTSVAAASAVRAAAAGQRTLVLSTDPAHSLADVFDVALGSGPVRLAPRLEAEQIDVRARLEESWRGIRDYLVSLLAWGGVGEIEAEELAVLPGLDEVFALVDVRRHVDEGRHDLLVVDCAPTAETLRLLSLPAALGWYLDRVFPVQRKITNAVRPMLGRMTTMPLPEDRTLAAVEHLHHSLARVRAVLEDGDTTTVRLVVNAERMVITEAQRTFTLLCLFGYHVDGVVVNRLLPDVVADPYLAGWKARQAEHLETIRDGFADVPILTAPLFDAEPIGADRLAPLGEAVYGQRPVQAVLHRGEPLTVSRDGRRYVLGLALPFVERGDLDVFRRGDELYVKIGAYTRTIQLPASLRRGQVDTARVVDGRLEVAFRAPSDAATAGSRGMSARA